MKLFVPVVFVVAAVASGGCAAEQPQSPAAGLTQPVHSPQEPSLGRGPPAMEDVSGPYNMYVEESLRLMCAGPDPFFAFDSSKPLGDDQPTMKNLVLCMRSGALQGKTIKLVGHADPRGAAALNEQLGLQRAEKVKAFLVANGIDQARVETASVGAEDAAPGPKNWPTDRRVDIKLAPDQAKP